MTPMPAHIKVTTVVTTTYRCHHCQAQIHPGQYKHRGYGEQLLDEWLKRHQHGQPAQPTEKEPST